MISPGYPFERWDDMLNACTIDSHCQLYIMKDEGGS